MAYTIRELAGMTPEEMAAERQKGILAKTWTCSNCERPVTCDPIQTAKGKICSDCQNDELSTAIDKYPLGRPGVRL